MIYLLLVSIAWAFSFGLIKGNLAGVDSNFVSFARMAFSLLVFLPFLKYKNLIAESSCYWRWTDFYNLASCTLHTLLRSITSKHTK